MDNTTVYAILGVCLKSKGFVGQPVGDRIYLCNNLSDCCTVRVSHIWLVSHTLYSEALISNHTSVPQAPSIYTALPRGQPTSGHQRVQEGAGVKHPGVHCCPNKEHSRTADCSLQPPSTFSESISLNSASLRPGKISGRH